MEYKLIFLYIVIFFYFTGINANDEQCTKENEKYCTERNRCESGCTYDELINYQLTRSFCICKEGFARNKDGNCIEPKMCGEFCGVNEILDKEALEKNLPCTKFCSCKNGFFRVDKECVRCNISSKQKSRCEIFNPKTCSCTKCKSEFKFCKGRCSNNHLNCRTYDAIKTCQCINCETGYTNYEGSCVKDVAHCDKYDEKGQCVACKTGRTFCNNTCVSNNCIGGTILDLSLCICVCPPNKELCGSKCVKPVCKCPWQFFSPQTCKCECKEGAFPCKNSCYPYINNCKSYKNDTCKCEFCNPGYKLCNGKCAAFKCNVNEYFIDSICKCDCKEGFFKNEKGVCTSTEINIEISIFHKLFLEIIYSFLPPGYGFCHRNEFYSSSPLKYEMTCRGPRTPNPTERCFCKTGFIRDKRTNTCVKVCPLPGNPCDTHEVYECGPERYCKRKFTKIASIEAAIGKSPKADKEDALVSVDVEIGQSSNKTSSDSQDKQKKTTDSDLIDVDVNINTDETKTKSKEDELLSASVSVGKIASVDVEVGGNSKESENSKSTSDSSNKNATQENTSEDELLDVSVEVGDVAEVSIEIDQSKTESTSKSKEVSVEIGIEDEIIFRLPNEEFCGYHCSKGFGRFGSVCKKCGT